MSIEITWEEPPSNLKGRGKRFDIAQAAKSRPGEWLCVTDKYPYMLAKNLKDVYGLETKFDGPGGKVYARYNGESS